MRGPRRTGRVVTAESHVGRLCPIRAGPAGPEVGTVSRRPAGRPGVVGLRPAVHPVATPGRSPGGSPGRSPGRSPALRNASRGPRLLPTASRAAAHPRRGECVWLVEGPDVHPTFHVQLPRKFGSRRDLVPHPMSSKPRTQFSEASGQSVFRRGIDHPPPAATTPATRRLRPPGPAQECRPGAALPASTPARVPAAGSPRDSDPGVPRKEQVSRWGVCPSGLGDRQDRVTGGIRLSSHRNR